MIVIGIRVKWLYRAANFQGVAVTRIQPTQFKHLSDLDRTLYNSLFVSFM